MLVGDSEAGAGGVPGGVHDGLGPLLALLDESRAKAGGEQVGVLGDVPEALAGGL